MNVRTRKTARGERRYQARAAGKSRTFALRQDARRWALEQERRASLGELYVAPAETFGAELGGFLERETGLRPKTLRNRRQDKHLLDCFRSTPLPQLRRADVEDEIARIARRAPRQAQVALALLKRVIRAARSRGQQVDEAILDIPAPRYESTEGRALSLADMQEVAGRMPDYIRRIVPVAGLTGLRQGELFDLSDSDLDLEAGTLLVRGGKTKAARRTVHLCAEARRLLREQLLARPNRAGGFRPSSDDARADGRVKPGGEAGLISGPYLVFPTLTGKRWSATNFMSRHFRPAVKAAGNEGVRFHDLRGSYATLALAAGVDVRTLAGELGHADGGALLLRRYGHLLSDSGERAARALDRMLEADEAVAL